MKEEQKDIIERLIAGKLKSEEREKLNNYKHIDEALREQWSDVTDMNMNPVKEDKILENIMRRIAKKKYDSLKHLLYVYGGAAVLALCIVMSTLLLEKHPDKEIVYIRNTGYQSMDSVKLADGTTVMLNAGSSLAYPEVFSGDKRVVELSGQAFFNVVPDEKKPFVVKTKMMDVTVLGTAFEVFSYENDANAETVLLEGAVQIEIPDNKNLSGRTYVLKPNEKLAYQTSGEVVVTTVDANSYSSWRNGKTMSFKNETLEMILPRLEKWYGQKIICDPKIAGHYRFTFTMHNESLELILNFISHSASLTHRLISNGQYIIEEKE